MDHNSFSKNLEVYFKEGTDAFLPHISINCAVLGYRDNNLWVYLHRIPGQDKWLIPGGYVKKTESLDEAAMRNLNMFGLPCVYLRQIRTFGDPLRNAEITHLIPEEMLKLKEVTEWIRQRFVTITYYGLVNMYEMEQPAHELPLPYCWMRTSCLENIALDHAHIIHDVLDLLHNELLFQPIALNLLPEYFTLNQLRGLYESILGRNIDRGSFRRKMYNQGIVEKVDRLKENIGRPANLYRFNKKEYHKSLREEVRFGF